MKKTAISLTPDEVSEIVAESLEGLLETLFNKGVTADQVENIIDEISETILETKYQEILDELYGN